MNNKNNTVSKKIKIIFYFIIFIILSLGVYYLIEVFSGGEPSYFTQHFLGAIALVCTGIVALLMPLVTTSKLSGSTQGDSLMLIVGILLILCGLLSIVISYSGGLI